ncbi:MAG TPA: hypothetical protein VEF04_04310, partial [Blastocatellia bacterium]|nr:hypothetical protein [Blastocatellia bacterium]
LVVLIGLIAAPLAFMLMSSGKNPFRQLEKTAAARSETQGCCSNMPAVSRRMIGTYYTTEDQFRSMLILNNKGPHVISVTPTLHGKNGQTFTAPQVLVNSESSLQVDLNELAASAGVAFRSGSFEFTYEGKLLEVGGGLQIINADKRLIFDEQLLEPGMKFSSSQLEAVYAIPFDSARVEVIMTNTSAQPLSVNGDATFIGANGHHPIHGQLKAYETQVVSLPFGLIKNASAGAISLTHNGGTGALLALIHLQDDERGYSETVNFVDPTRGRTSQLQGAGLRLGNINNDVLRPVIAVRNLGDSTTTVAASVPYAKQNGNTGKISLPQASLAPGEFKLLDTSTVQLRQNDFATAGLEIEYTGTPGSVIAMASSISASGNHVFAVPLKDPQGGLSSTGGYPWFINGSASTVVFIKNTTNEAQQFHMDVIYPGGRWGSNLKTLGPGQTFALDVRKVRDEQQEGSEGNTIPLEASAGHVYWSIYGTADKRLIGRAQTIDTANGLASTYECQCPCTSSYAQCRLLPPSVIGFPGDTTQFLAQQRDQNCHGTLGSWYNVTATNFWSTNTSVATINSSGYATAVAPGSTTLYGSLNAVINYWNGSGCAVQYITPSASAICDVNPRVTIASNLVGVPKNDTAEVDVTLSPSPSSTSITLRLSTTSGTGEARFASNNSTTLTITQSSTISIKGITESSTANNIRLEAVVGNPETQLAYRDFSVVWVTLSFRTGTGQSISNDNGAKSVFSQLLGTTNLGTFLSSGTNPNHIWRNGVEIVGTVAPSNYSDLLVLRRTIDGAKLFYDQTQQLSTAAGTDDTSDTILRDDDPQSGGSQGKIYDLDAPGTGTTSSAPIGRIVRQRVNFTEYATIQVYQNGQVVQAKCSSNLQWYSCISIEKTSSGDVLKTGVTGDNQAGTGTIPLTWNLQ